jgi:hypothetical protein
MQIDLPQPSPAKLARLEAAATAHPARYRFSLRALALFGDAMLTFVRVFPLAFIPIVFTLILGNQLFYWVSGFAILTPRPCASTRSFCRSTRSTRTRNPTVPMPFACATTPVLAI